MPYVIIGFVIILGVAGFKIYNYGDDSGYNRGMAETTAIKNAELTQLNQDNEILNNRLVRFQRQRNAEAKGIENEYKSKIKANRAAHDLALNQYGNTVRVLLNEAQSNREDKDRRKREIVTAFINGAPGTEGAKLTPETRRDLELMSLDGDQAIILLGLCTAIAEADREPSVATP